MRNLEPFLLRQRHIYTVDLFFTQELKEFFKEAASEASGEYKDLDGLVEVCNCFG